MNLRKKFCFLQFSINKEQNIHCNCMTTVTLGLLVSKISKQKQNNSNNQNNKAVELEFPFFVS